jgi:hypothetical protein
LPQQIGDLKHLENIVAFNNEIEGIQTLYEATMLTALSSKTESEN